jgi:hypothetical protein
VFKIALSNLILLEITKAVSTVSFKSFNLLSKIFVSKLVTLFCVANVLNFTVFGYFLCKFFKILIEVKSKSSSIRTQVLEFFTASKRFFNTSDQFKL